MRHAPPIVIREDLSLVEQALLWSMRAWVLGHRATEDVAEPIQDMFDHLGAPAASRDLDRFMLVLSRGVIRPLTVNCVCVPVVSGDERTLLDVFALQQNERCDEALALLATFTTEAAACACCDCSSALARALMQAARLLPAPRPPFDDAAAVRAPGPLRRMLH